MYAEFELIEKIRALFDTPEGLTLGIGDDCAILDPGRFDLVTTDTLVEGVHFTRTFSSASDIGYKSIAVSMSDIAAMGGGPGAFFMNLTLGPDVDENFVDGLLAGMKEACDVLVPEGFEVAAGGGDITQSPGPTVITITMLGEASPAGPVTRSGALPGDRIALLGPVGLAAAGLAILEGKLEVDAEDPHYESLINAHRRPAPRVVAGALLGLYGIPSALIDISDGLAQDLSHILSRSGVGATVEIHNLPRHAALTRLQSEHGFDVLDAMLRGGDDYELLIVVPPARMTKLWDLARRNEWDVHDIGEIRANNEGLRLVAPDGKKLDIDTTGYQHFRSA